MKKSMEARLAGFQWSLVREALHTRGYAVLKQVFSPEECLQSIREYADERLYRKSIQMERYRFGRGEYKYYRYPLPDRLQATREALYPYLVPVANAWMQALNQPMHYPDTLSEFHAQCREHHQTEPTPLILKYGPGDFNTLHQDIYGEVFFPMQAVVFLNDAGAEYEGGEFVLSQQIPRTQSQATVLQPGRGDLLIFATQFRPQPGSKGFYKVQVKHGVSALHRGERHTLGIIFHDARASS